MHEVVESVSLLPAVGDMVDLVQIRGLLGDRGWGLLSVRLMLLGGLVVGLEMSHIPYGRAARRQSLELKGVWCYLLDNSKGPDVRGI